MTLIRRSSLKKDFLFFFFFRGFLALAAEVPSGSSCLKVLDLNLFSFLDINIALACWGANLANISMQF